MTGTVQSASTKELEPKGQDDMEYYDTSRQIMDVPKGLPTDSVKYRPTYSVELCFLFRNERMSDVTVRY
jgi:hypothetical protein